MFLQELVVARMLKESSHERAQHITLFSPKTASPSKLGPRAYAIESGAEKQLRNVASMPFIYKWVAAMPDVHWGIGATVGSVIPTKGRDHSRGGRRRYRLRHDGGPDDTERQPFAGQFESRCARAIEKAVPHGRTENGRKGDRGAWHNIPDTSWR